jgi:HK97 family phage major capsid protein
MTRAARRGERRDGNGWYRITNSADGPSTILIYDEIGFWGVTASDFIRDISSVNGPVDVHINSPGGDVFDAYAIYNALAARPGVRTIVDALAASSASVIAMAGEERLMAPMSQMMIHEAWAVSDGDSDSLRHMADRLDTVSGQIAEVYAVTAGGDAAQFRDMMRDETWFTPQQALDAGLITGIAASAREPATAARASGRAPAGAVVGSAPSGDGDSADPGVTALCRHFGFTPEQVAEMDEAARALLLASLGDSPAGAADPQDAKADDSAWDAGKAWGNASDADDKAAFYNGICAGKKAGDPNTQAAHALPHHYHPSDPPNVTGTRNALGRLPQTDGLTNEAQAKAHLEAHMKAINPDYEPGNRDSAQVSAAHTSSAVPQVPGDQSRRPFAGDGRPAAAAAGSTGRETDMSSEDQGVLTVEGRRARIEEIKSVLRDMARDYAGQVMPKDTEADWDRLITEKDDHIAAVAAHDRRAAQLAAMEAGDGDGSHDRPFAGEVAGRAGTFGAPAVHIRPDNIYDIADIRQKAKRDSDLPGLYRDYAMRAVEAARFPGSNRETAQTNVSRLLDSVPDDKTGWLARRILNTGNPSYKRVFGRAMSAGNPGALGAHDGQVLALGESDTGAYAVPFELDPTIILTSDGVINPLRQIARVEQITGKEYDLVSSAGVTVSWASEFDEATNNAPTLTQPTIKPEKVHGFIPFSVEIEQDWTGLQSEMMRLLADAKDVAEATNVNGFVLGDGTAPHASGLISTLGASSVVTAAGTGSFSVDDVYKVKNSVPPRFRARGSFLAEAGIYDKVRQFGTGTMANVWVDLGGENPPKLIGYPARELSAMADTVATGNKIMMFGDYKQFLIVDRLGMNTELVPHVFGPANRYPTGTRGYYCWWRTNSVILTSKAFGLLKVG